MDEVTFGYILRGISVSINILGMVVGVDLIVGAPLIKAISKLLNKVIDVDKILTKTATRIGAGIIFVVISAVMLCAILRAG